MNNDKRYIFKFVIDHQCINFDYANIELRKWVWARLNEKQCPAGSRDNNHPNRYCPGYYALYNVRIIMCNITHNLYFFSKLRDIRNLHTIAFVDFPFLLHATLVQTKLLFIKATRFVSRQSGV